MPTFRNTLFHLHRQVEWLRKAFKNHDFSRNHDVLWVPSCGNTCLEWLRKAFKNPSIIFGRHLNLAHCRILVRRVTSETTLLSMFESYQFTQTSSSAVLRHFGSQDSLLPHSTHTRSLSTFRICTFFSAGISSWCAACQSYAEVS
jgi:hypothetical protein